MKSLPQVLIVDDSSDSREVLRTLLERRGAVTIEARRPEQAIRLAVLHHPDVIVLDAESDRSSGGQATVELQQAAHLHATPLVILGTIRPAAGGDAPHGQFVPKPYHYAPLIRRIEELMAAA